MTDRKDQKALMRQSQVPNFVRLEEYNGFPSMNGLGREGLEVSAKYRIPQDRVAEFEELVQEEGSQWQPLPIPNEVMEKILFEFPSVNLKASNGFFRCRTAGDNVLYNKDTSSCLTPKVWVMVDKDQFKWEREEVALSSIDSFPDIIISIYESDMQTISVGVASGY